MVNGYTFLTKETTSSDTKPEGPLVPVNTLYMSLRYYFPVQNKFSWDRQTMKKKKARKKQREKNKRQRQKQNVHKEPKSVLGIFKSSKKDAKK